MAKPLVVPDKNPEARLHLSMFNRSRAYRREFDKNWATGMKWLLGQQYSTDKVWWQKNAVINLMFAQAMSIIPFVGFRRPDIQIDARNVNLKKLAAEITTLVNRAASDNDIEDRSLEAVFGMVTMGGGWWKITRNNKLNGGLGGIEHRTVPTFSMFLQPGVQTLEDSSYVYEVKSYDKISMLRRFPDRRREIDAIFRKHDSVETKQVGDTLAADAGIGQNLNPEASGEFGPGQSMATTSEGFYYSVARSFNRERGTVDVIEAHFLDNSTREVELEIEDKRLRDKTTPKPDAPGRKSTPVYPNGHVVTFSGDYILEDRAEPFPFSPYVHLPNYYLEGLPYSVSDIELQRPLQREMNESVNLLFDLTRKSGGRTTYAGPGANLDSEMITGEPNEVVHVDSTAPDDLLIADHANVPVALQKLPDMIKGMMEEAVGLSDTLRGEVPGDVRSGFAIEQLQQGAANRMKLKTRVLERALKQASIKYMHIMSKTYRPDIEFSPMIFDGIEVTDPVDGKRLMQMKDLKPHLFDFAISAGVNLRSSRASDQQNFQWMLEVGIIDKQYYLEHVDIPDKAELMQRMEPQFEAERAAAQQPPPPQGV